MTVTTIAELNALPDGAVVIDRLGLAWQKYTSRSHDQDGALRRRWTDASNVVGSYGPDYLLRRAPLTLVHDPREDSPGLPTHVEVTQVIARSFHAHFEEKAKKRNPGYEITAWEDIGPTYQQEFLEYAGGAAHAVIALFKGDLT